MAGENTRAASAVSAIPAVPAVAKTARGIVARGRTVWAAHPTLTRIIGQKPDGTPLHHPVHVAFGPGNEVELEAGEIESLRRNGFLLDPERPLAATGEGPSFVEAGARAHVG